MKDAPTFEGRLYTDCEPNGLLGNWVRRAEYDAALDRIRELELALRAIKANILTKITSTDPFYIAGIKAGLGIAADMASKSLDGAA